MDDEDDDDDVAWSSYSSSVTDGSAYVNACSGFLTKARTISAISRSRSAARESPVTGSASVFCSTSTGAPPSTILIFFLSFVLPDTEGEVDADSTTGEDDEEGVFPAPSSRETDDSVPESAAGAFFVFLCVRDAVTLRFVPPLFDRGACENEPDEEAASDESDDEEEEEKEEEEKGNVANDTTFFFWFFEEIAMSRSE